LSITFVCLALVAIDHQRCQRSSLTGTVRAVAFVDMLSTTRSDSSVVDDSRGCGLHTSHLL